MVVRLQTVSLQLRETHSITGNKFSRWYLVRHSLFALTPLHAVGILLLFIWYRNKKNLWFYLASTVLCVYTCAGQWLKSFDMQAALGFLVFPGKCAMMSSKCHSTTVKTQFPGVTAESGIKTFCSPGVLPMQLHRGVFLLAPSFTFSHIRLNATEPWVMTF